MGALGTCRAFVISAQVLGKKGYEWEFHGPAHECVGGRAPPLSKEDFWEELQRKSFTSKKADLPTVSGLYKAAFDKRLGEARNLNYTGLGWGDVEMLSLSKVIACGAMAGLRVTSVSTRTRSAMWV